MCITFIRYIKGFCFSFFLLLSTLQAQDINKAQLARQYYEQGELEKAKNTYEKLARDRENIPFIHHLYFELLLSENDYKEAESYLEKVSKWYPDNTNYKIDRGLIYLAAQDEEKAEAIFNKVIREVSKNPVLVRTTAQYFFQQDLPLFTVETYLQGRKESDNPVDFSLELANVYQRINNKEGMISEYLNFVQNNPANLDYVQNVMQNILNEPEDLQALERVLYDKIQKSPNNQIYNELLIWVNLQLKNFQSAFIQARALDKRGKEGGKRLLDIGIIALQNKDYESAAKVFSYVIETYSEGINYEIARRYLIKSREEIIKNSFPVEKQAIHTLIDDYQQLIDDLGINQVTLEAMRSKALLHAFYLDQKDSAIQLLEKVIHTPRANPQLVADAKIDLGDIYLLMDQPWESTLLYAQVEKAANESPLGYKAKLKNAKLSYYKGDFELAQARLDILKLATSREIANDALSLSLLIQDNIAFDTTGSAMRDYAAIDLLLFQHKNEAALAGLDSMLVRYPGHSLTDEIWWRKAQIRLEQGNFEKAIALLDQIVHQYPYDILSDDAYFLMGTIMEDHLGKTKEAMEIYQSLLVRYPGSLYTAEARKRFRKLRGDFM